MAAQFGGRVHRKNVPRLRNSLEQIEDDEDLFHFQNQQDSDSDQASAAPKPRLRWTPELHGLFLKAVHELGGPNKATPKGILNAMDVEGISLHHLKSHLQKFRLGKIGKRLWKREQLVSADFYWAKDGAFPFPIPPEALEVQTSLASDGNESWHDLTKIFAAEAQIEPQATKMDCEMTSTKMETDSSSGKMVICLDDDETEQLPLPVPQFGTEFTFPDCLNGGRREQPGFPMNFDNELMEDYLNSLNQTSDGFTVEDGKSGAGDKD